MNTENIPLTGWNQLPHLVNEFTTEKELCDHIELNIATFTKQCLGLEYKAHKREYPIRPVISTKFNRVKRVDFLITSKCGKTAIVECKNPNQSTQISHCLGQVLEYASTLNILGHPLDMQVLLSTKLEPSIATTIRHYSLPVLYIAMDKDNFLFSSIDHLQNKDGH